MLGAKLARRIVLPLLILIAALFAILAVAAVRIAESSVAAELEEQADRIAATLHDLPTAPEHRPDILNPLAGLVGVDLIVEDFGTGDWSAVERAAAAPPRATLGGAEYRVLARQFGPRRTACLVLFDVERVAQRRREVLGPVALAGAAGLLVALLLGLAVARTIARPVKELADAVTGFAGGDPDAAPAHRGPGEIGDLHDAYFDLVRAIRESETKLRESERFAALGRLAGGIAHELRNPLTAIRMAVETATDGDETDRADARRVALAEIDRLDRTLRELLDFVRPRPRVHGPVDLGALVRDAAMLLMPQCDHLQVRLELDADEGGTVDGDADRLKQAVLNLVLNGAQAQPSGGAVRLKAGPRSIEVADDGPGIAPEVRDTIFQPFVTTRAAGIGLGLAVVRQVADEHGADLEVATGAGGTTFILRFSP